MKNIDKGELVIPIFFILMGEHGYSILGHPHPSPKSFCPGPHRRLEKAPHILRIFFLDVQLLCIFNSSQSEFLTMMILKVFNRVLDPSLKDHPWTDWKK